MPDKLINKTYGRLKIINIDKIKSTEKRKYYITECSCKNNTIKSFRSDQLSSGKITSCGCMRIKNKENMICSYCGSKERVSKYKDGEYLCHKHYMQFYHTGVLKDNFMKDKNKIIIHKDYAEIILYDKSHKEKARALIDLDDVDKCKIYKWGLTSNGYVISKLPNNNYLLLHRFILNLKNEQLDADHLFHNTLDNRKENLRKATYSQNNMNQNLSKRNTSGFKGVSWNERDNLWHSYIGINNKRINLGWFKKYEDAVNERLQAEFKYYKEFSIHSSNTEKPKKIIVLAGFSSAGKDKICKYISDNYNYKMVISHTSRPIRPNESEGNPYYFITRKQFEEMIEKDEFIECRKYNTLLNNNPDVWYYGVHKNSIRLEENNYIVVLDILGLIEFKKHFGNNITSFFIEVDEPTRKQRAIARDGFDETEWNRRYEDDKNKFTDEIINREVDYIVENYDFDKCIKEILNKIGEI